MGMFTQDELREFYKDLDALHQKAQADELSESELQQRKDALVREHVDRKKAKLFPVTPPAKAAELEAADLRHGLIPKVGNLASKVETELASVRRTISDLESERTQLQIMLTENPGDTTTHDRIAAINHDIQTAKVKLDTLAAAKEQALLLDESKNRGALERQIYRQLVRAEEAGLRKMQIAAELEDLFDGRVADLLSEYAALNVVSIEASSAISMACDREHFRHVAHILRESAGGSSGGAVAGLRAALERAGIGTVGIQQHGILGEGMWAGSRDVSLRAAVGRDHQQLLSHLSDIVSRKCKEHAELNAGIDDAYQRRKTEAEERLRVQHDMRVTLPAGDASIIEPAPTTLSE